MTVPTPPLAVFLPPTSTTSHRTANPFDTPDVQISRPSSLIRLPNDLDFINNRDHPALDLESRGNSRDSSWDRSRSRGGSKSRDPLYRKSLNNNNTTLWNKVINSMPFSNGIHLTQEQEYELEQPRGRRLSAVGEGTLTLGIRTSAMIVDDGTTKKKRKGLKIMSRTKAQLVISFSLIALVGMNDSATGANLVSMQAHYQVSYDQISIVFLSNVAGYFISCVSSSFLTHHLGLQYSLVIACFVLALGCLIMAIAPPFAVFASALSLLGFGSGLFDACLTTVISYDEDPIVMSYMYSMFGVGATIAPLIIGGFVDRGVNWNYYYFIPLAIVIGLTTAAFFIFSDYKPPEDEPHALPSSSTSTDPIPLTTTTSTTTMSSKISHGESGAGKLPTNMSNLGIGARMMKALRIRAVLIGFFLVILAFGSADTLSAFLVSFSVEERNFPPAASRYELSAVWAGISLGRVALAFLGRKLGEKTFSILLLVAASCCLGIVQGVRNVTVDALSMVLVGFFIGPVTPRVLSMVAARVPPSLKSSVMSLTIGLGLIGSSAGPLLFGVVAGRGGLANLPVVLIGANVLAALGWMMIPRKVRRED